MVMPLEVQLWAVSRLDFVETLDRDCCADIAPTLQFRKVEKARLICISWPNSLYAGFYGDKLGNTGCRFRQELSEDNGKGGFGNFPKPAPHAVRSPSPGLPA